MRKPMPCENLLLTRSIAFINEAITCLETGVATKEDIDTTLKLGMNHPMGPLVLADLLAPSDLSISWLIIRQHRSRHVLRYHGSPLPRDGRLQV
jgi:3-hydroxyacyl-CoA dehydrogenase